MVADQRKKRSTASSIVGCTSRKRHKAKKKKLGLKHYDLNMRSNISLQWDEKKKSVVSKREQIGISWKELYPFIDALPQCSNTLADVFTVPRGIFELENLTEVLSDEVWQTHLSENERNLLSHFLPKDSEPHKVVQELLAGDNFHFGNPFLRWGSLLCSGNLHPDYVLHREMKYKAYKKAYCSELQNYHNDMIGSLQTWKGRWESCKDSESEIVQKIWSSKSRSRKHAQKSVPAHANDFRPRDPDENLVATSDSCSWAADEKAYSSDNPNVMHGEPQRQKGFMEGKYDSSSDGPKLVAQPRKLERLQKHNIQCDGAKYMSYIKVSKEQHQRVKNSMKHSSNSIQPRFLNNVLGNLDTFHVRPFEVFEEEERQKLHEHWLQLAVRVVPAAFANWRRRQLEKWELTKSLQQEMEEQPSLKSLKEVSEDMNCHDMLSEQKDDETSDLEPTITSEDVNKEKSESLLEEQMDNGIALQGDEKQNPNCVLQEQMDNEATNHRHTMEDNNAPVSACLQNQDLHQISSFSGSHEFHSMDLDSDNNHVMAKIDDISPSVSKYPDNLSHVDCPVSRGNAVSSASDTWPAVSIPGSYYHSTSVSHDYRSASDLSLGHPQDIEEQPADRSIVLESEMREEAPGKDLLHRQHNVSFFSPHPSQDRNELLQSFFKGQGSLPYHNEQKQTGLDFQPASNVMLETGQFPRHFGEQLHCHSSMPVELGQKRLNDLYLHPNIQEPMYPHGGRYSIPRQDRFLQVNIPDWAGNNNIRMSAPPQSHLNGGEFLSQNWFSGDHQAPTGWSGSDSSVGPNRIGNGNNADQSLFSVLSECQALHSGASYDSVGPTEQLMQSRNYGRLGAAVPTTSSMLPQMVNPLNYLSGHEANNAGLKNNNIGWMGLPHQDSALQDSMRKPFLRSWDR